MKNFLNKVFSDPIVSSFLTIIAGILTVVFSTLAFKMATIILGCLSFILGLVNVVKYFNEPKDGKYNLLTGLLFGISGIAFIFESEILVPIVAVVIGIIVLYHGLINLENSLAIKKSLYKYWYLSLIFALLTGIAGVLLIVMRTKFGSHLELITGITLIVEGVLNAWTAIKVKSIYD